MITIIDAGLGNFNAIANMYRYLEIDVEVQRKPLSTKKITHLILPGVGSFDKGMELIEASGWRDAIENLNPETKVLGVCVGMQLLTKGSEEGKRVGLSLIDATCRKFDVNLQRVPHMGWNSVKSVKKNSLLDNSVPDRNFYFSHSYYVESSQSLAGLFSTTHEEPFLSGVNIGNVYGVQFHPEKSHKSGLELLTNFASL